MMAQVYGLVISLALVILTFSLALAISRNVDWSTVLGRCVAIEAWMVCLLAAVLSLVFVTISSRDN